MWHFTLSKVRGSNLFVLKYISGKMLKYLIYFGDIAICDAYL